MQQIQSLLLDDDNLKFSIGRIYSYARRTMVNLVYRYYTDHSIDHLERVARIIDRILQQNEALDILNQQERYILRAATLLHDIGMQAETVVEEPDERRQEHHLIAGEMIAEDWKYIGIEEPYVQVIALVIEGHRGNIDERFQPQRIGTGTTIRVDLLAALLCIADELDLSFERVDSHRLTTLKYPTDAQLHFFKHHFTQAIDIEQSRCIKLVFRYPPGRTSQYHHIFGKYVVDKVRSSLKQIGPVLEKHQLHLALRDQDIEVTENAALAPLAPEVFSSIFDASIGMKNYRSLRSIPFGDMTGDIQPELFFEGNVRWEDIVNELDIVRTQFEQVRSNVRALYIQSCEEQCVSTFLIAGEGGAGKTTVLMRLAYELCKDDSYKGVNLLWLPPDSAFSWHQLTHLYYSTQNPILLFVDGIGIDRIVHDMTRSISSSDAPSVPVVVVFAARLNEWTSAKGPTIPHKHHIELELQCLTDQEATDLCSKLEQYGQLRELEPLTQNERFHKLRYQSSGQLLVAMLEATRGRKLYDIVVDEYNNLKKQYIEAARAYEYISLMFLFDVLIPIELLLTLTRCVDLDDFRDRVLHHTRLIIVRHSFTRYGLKYRPRHRTIAEALITSLDGYQTLRQRLKVAAVIFRSIGVFDRQQRYVAIEFLQNVFRDIKSGVKLNYENDINCLVEFLERFDDTCGGIQKAAVVDRSIPELILWARLYRGLGMKRPQIRAYESILEIDPRDQRTNYQLAKVLSRTRTSSQDPERVASYYRQSYVSGNRRIQFVFEYVRFCISHNLYDELDQVADGISDFVAYTNEEERLRGLIYAMLEGYRFKKDRDQLVADFDNIRRQMRITDELGPQEQMRYTELMESDDFVRATNTYEKYLETIKPVRPKGVLLKIAVLSSHNEAQVDKSLTYFKELYDNHLKESTDPEDFDVMLRYAILCAKVDHVPKSRVYALFRKCIKLKRYDLRGYVGFAEYAAQVKDLKTARGVVNEGLKVSRSTDQSQTYLAQRLLEINSSFGG